MNNSKNSSLIGLTSALITALLFAAAVNIAPFAYVAGASVVMLLSLRFIMCLLSSVVMTGEIIPRQSVKKIDIVLLSFIGFAFVIQAYGYLLAVKLVPVSIAVTVFYTFPILTFVIDRVILSRSFKLLPIIGLVTALLGVWFLSQDGSNSWNIDGIFWALLAALMQAAITIVSQRVVSVSGWRMVKYTSILPALIFSISYYLIGTVAFSYTAVFWCLLAAICFCIGLWFFYRSIHLIGSVRTANILYMEPVFTFILALVFFSYYLNPLQLIGIAMIVTATLALEILEGSR